MRRGQTEHAKTLGHSGACRARVRAEMEKDPELKRMVEVAENRKREYADRCREPAPANGDPEQQRPQENMDVSTGGPTRRAFEADEDDEEERPAQRRRINTPTTSSSSSSSSTSASRSASTSVNVLQQQNPEQMPRSYEVAEVFSPPRITQRCREKGFRPGWSWDILAEDPLTRKY